MGSQTLHHAHTQGICPIYLLILLVCDCGLCVPLEPCIVLLVVPPALTLQLLHNRHTTQTILPYAVQSYYQSRSDT